MGVIVSTASSFRVTKAYADLSPEPGGLLRTLQGISAGTVELNHWIWIHRYLVEFSEKFGTEVAGPRAFARGLLDAVDDEIFFTCLGRILERGTVVRCVFADDEQGDADRILERQLRENVFGDRFGEGMVVSQAARRHTLLAAPQTVLPVLEDVVRACS